jgi:non-canonical (house-cleaning) NTP pyrophosphatase
MRIALGSSRASKIEEVRAASVRIASINETWRDPIISALDVQTDAPAMPLSDRDLMSGARARALAVRQLLANDSKTADVYIGLEGGFHSVTIDGEELTFLKGWAYVTDGTRGNFGATPSVVVPNNLVRGVVDGKRELADVIDEAAGEHDVRSRQALGGFYPATCSPGR